MCECVKVWKCERVKVLKCDSVKVWKCENFKKYSEIRGATSISDAFIPSIVHVVDICVAYHLNYSNEIQNLNSDSNKKPYHHISKFPFNLFFIQLLESQIPTPATPATTTTTLQKASSGDKHGLIDLLVSKQPEN